MQQDTGEPEPVLAPEPAALEDHLDQREAQRAAAARRKELHALLEEKTSTPEKMGQPNSKRLDHLLGLHPRTGKNHMAKHDAKVTSQDLAKLLRDQQQLTQQIEATMAKLAVYKVCLPRVRCLPCCAHTVNTHAHAHAHAGEGRGPRQAARRRRRAR